jgi:hypothetical protein
MHGMQSSTGGTSGAPSCVSNTVAVHVDGAAPPTPSPDTHARGDESQVTQNPSSPREREGSASSIGSVKDTSCLSSLERPCARSPRHGLLGRASWSRG